MSQDWISDEGLARIEQAIGSDDDPCTPDVVKALIAEIRRLRGEIAADNICRRCWRCDLCCECCRCHRCEGSGLAYGADRPFEWSGPWSYPGPCPVCKGNGKEPACQS